MEIESALSQQQERSRHKKFDVIRVSSNGHGSRFIFHATRFSHRFKNKSGMSQSNVTSFRKILADLSAAPHSDLMKLCPALIALLLTMSASALGQDRSSETNAAWL